MKKIVVVIVGLCCLGLLAPSVASAKGKKGNKPNPEQVTAAKAIMAKYDANTNGMLDADEIAALQKDYAAGKATDALVFDVNNDKTLDDTEIATLQACLKAKHKKKAE